MLAVATGFVAVGVVNVVHRPGVGEALSAVVCVFIFVVIARSVRLIEVDGDCIVVRALLQRRSMDARACALGVRLSYQGSEGTHYVVYVTDGQSSVDLSEHGSPSRADRAADALRVRLGLVEDGALRARVAASRAAWEADLARAHAVVDSYYRGRAWRTIRWVLPAIVVLCALGMWLWMSWR